MCVCWGGGGENAEINIKSVIKQTVSKHLLCRKISQVVKIPTVLVPTILHRTPVQTILPSLKQCQQDFADCKDSYCLYSYYPSQNAWTL